MGLVIDWKKNEILRGIHEEGREEGREQAGKRPRGRPGEALRFAVRTMLTARFGKLPRWGSSGYAMRRPRSSLSG